MPLRLLFVLALCLLSTACREIPPEAEGTNIFPLFRYASYKDSDDYELDILWPLFHKSLVRDRSTFRLILFQNEELPPVLSRTFLFPIFAATRTPVRNDLTLVPLFGWEDEGNKSTFKVIPFWLDTVAAVLTMTRSAPSCRRVSS